MRRGSGRLLVVAMGVVVVAGCGRFGRRTAPTRTLPEVPEHLRAGRGGGPAVTEVAVDDPAAMSAVRERGRERERDLMWTDPDNPEAGLMELEEAMEEGGRQGPWGASLSEGLRRAVRGGRPVVLWFTDSKRSPVCGILGAEVFATPEFTAWAGEKVVRVRLDFEVQGTSEDDRLRKEDYLGKLKKRYEVMGTPAVLVLAPDGTVTGRYRGYKQSYGQFYFDRLKRAVEAAETHHREWTARMERRGYRRWTDERGRTMFAKLLRYRKGELILAEPNGGRIRARESDLSEGDREWIRGEIEKRRERKGL